MKTVSLDEIDPRAASVPFDDPFANEPSEPGEETFTSAHTAPTAADTVALYQGLLAWVAIDRSDSGCAQRARFLWFIGNNLNAGPTQIATVLGCQKSQALNILREYSAAKDAIVSRISVQKGERAAYR